MTISAGTVTSTMKIRNEAPNRPVASSVLTSERMIWLMYT